MECRTFYFIHSIHFKLTIRHIYIELKMSSENIEKKEDCLKIGLYITISTFVEMYFTSFINILTPKTHKKLF